MIKPAQMKVISFRVPTDIKEKIDQICERDKITKSEFLRVNTKYKILMIENGKA